MKTGTKATFISSKVNDLQDGGDKDNYVALGGTKGGWLNSTTKVSALE